MRPQAHRQAARHGEAVILFGVASSIFAISASAVEEIRSTEGLEPAAANVTAKLAKVRNVLVRDGKTHYAIDANLHFRMLPSCCTHLLILRDHPAAIMVGRIDRMTEILEVHSLPRIFCGEERNWYRGLTLISTAKGEKDVVPLVNPDAFLTQRELEMLNPQDQRRAFARGGF